ncbi:MAG: acyl carrier protein [Geobacteraceae bacterium GWC2_58_44]|nr:MAG: acyl carrier protein [Geobacteraceae bacterium GWC2_58_44]HBG05647.1 acyl carrier protein [Geobacter sp.]
MSLQEDIREFIVENFLFGDEGGLHDDSSFLEEGIVDSTGIMQLVSFLQEQYLIAIEDEELIPDNLDSIKKVTNFIEDKKRALMLGSTGSH